MEMKTFVIHRNDHPPKKVNAKYYSRDEQGVIHFNSGSGNVFSIVSMISDPSGYIRIETEGETT